MDDTRGDALEDDGPLIPEPGDVAWATSDPDGGSPDVGYYLRIDPETILWVGEITDRCLEDSGLEPDTLGGSDGWWIAICKGREQTIVGKVVDDMVGGEFVEMLAAAIRGARK